MNKHQEEFRPSSFQVLGYDMVRAGMPRTKSPPKSTDVVKVFLTRDQKAEFERGEPAVLIMQRLSVTAIDFYGRDS